MKQSGFSLVEIAVVLVILGLLSGGILAGQTLIRASELRTVTSEYQKYVTAINSFRGKYFQLPGDLSNATQFWSTAAACPGVSATPAGGTCNGNGNNMIELSALGATNPGNEQLRFWQQLALAGIIDHRYTGTTASMTAGSGDVSGKVNVPATRVSNMNWTVEWVGTVPLASTTHFEGDYGNVLVVSKRASQPIYDANYVAFKPEEAMNIDTKLDDGRPAIGLVGAYEAEGPLAGIGGCADVPAGNTSTLAASYKLSNPAVACSLIFKTR